MSRWVTDLRQVLPPWPDASADAVEHVAFLREVVEAATSRKETSPWVSAVPCRGRRGRKRCKARVQVQRNTAEISWACTGCADSGAVTHFAQTQADLSRYRPRGKTVLWGFDDAERDLLLAATMHIPVLRAIVARSQPHTEIVGLLYLQATVAELDEVYTLVEELTDMTRGRRRRELLDGLRATLCTSIDSGLSLRLLSDR